MTSGGSDILSAQYGFMAIYLTTLILVLNIYRVSKQAPPYALMFTCIIAYRVHSIYLLRLFNDPLAMLAVYGCICFLLMEKFTIACILFSCGLAIKMNVLLFLPGLLITLLWFRGVLESIGHLCEILLVQLVLGAPFLFHNPGAYIASAFNFGRQFMYKWTVNWRLLSEDVFLDRRFHLALLCLHFLFLFALLFHFVRSRGGIMSFLELHNPGRSPRKDQNGVVYPLFVSNFVGIVFSRSLHYQFYVWYFHTLVFLLWSVDRFSSPVRTPRSSSLIEEEMQRLNVLPDEPGDIVESHASVSTEPGHLIRCCSCTYLNKPTSFKCEQCFQVFRDPQELCQLNPKSTTSASIDHQASPSPPVAEKWSCPQCTYENWPKSKHCVMCYGPRPHFPLDSHSNVAEDITRKDKSSIQTSLTSLSQARIKRSKPISRDKLWLEACRAVLDGEVTPIERYLLVGGRLDRKLTKQDCRHLESQHQPPLSSDILHSSVLFDTACRVLEHELTCPFSLGASALGSTNTDDSVSATNYPKFRLGSTLVDLAIRFGRTDLVNLFIALSGLQTTSSALSMPGNGSSKDATRSSLASCLSNESVSQSKGVRRPSSVQTHPSSQHCVNRASNLSHRSKWMPCQASPHIARELRDSFASGIRHHHGNFACAYMAEWGTFALPHSITKLPSPVKYLLLSELCDTQVHTGMSARYFLSFLPQI
ncbi:unnamed protein product [Dicrocoelium dendriticum]|nr:unnamed protein product [Dicrocoelium dendriticum]